MRSVRRASGLVLTPICLSICEQDSSVDAWRLLVPIESPLGQDSTRAESTFGGSPLAFGVGHSDEDRPENVEINLSTAGTNIATPLMTVSVELNSCS